ncbi:MAG: hypothetical protein R3C42_09230 [Parvularculaceae bacterium]
MNRVSAQATAQMLESGDFPASKTNAQETGRHSLAAGGERRCIFVGRCARDSPSAASIAGAVLAALFTYWIGALVRRANRFFAALLLASAPALVGESTIAGDRMRGRSQPIAGAVRALVHISRR